MKRQLCSQQTSHIGPCIAGICIWATAVIPHWFDHECTRRREVTNGCLLRGVAAFIGCDTCTSFCVTSVNCYLSVISVVRFASSLRLEACRKCSSHSAFIRTSSWASDSRELILQDQGVGTRVSCAKNLLRTLLIL